MTAAPFWSIPGCSDDKAVQSQGIIAASITSSCNVILCKGWQTKVSVLLWLVLLVSVGALLN